VGAKAGEGVCIGTAVRGERKGWVGGNSHTAIAAASISNHSRSRSRNCNSDRDGSCITIRAHRGARRGARSVTHRMVRWNRMSVPGPSRFNVPVRSVPVVSPQLARMHEPGYRSHDNASGWGAQRGSANHPPPTHTHTHTYARDVLVHTPPLRCACTWAGCLPQSIKSGSHEPGTHTRIARTAWTVPVVATQFLVLHEHVKHVEDSTDAVNMLVGHAVHAAARAAANVPAPQDTQDADPGLAAVPAAHTEHTTAPADDAVPPGHTTASAVPPAQEKPAGHAVPLTPADPSGQYEPGGAVHGLHTAATPPAKLPAGHMARSAAPPVHANPVGHGVPVATVLPAGQKNPGAALHAPHDAGSTAPAAPLNLPTGHWVQLSAAEVTGAYEPGAHWAHAVAPMADVKRPTGHASHVPPAPVLAWPARHRSTTVPTFAKADENSEKGIRCRKMGYRSFPISVM
jgi:hypothetical protein